MILWAAVGSARVCLGLLDGVVGAAAAPPVAAAAGYEQDDGRGDGAVAVEYAHAPRESLVGAFGDAAGDSVDGGGLDMLEFGAKSLGFGGGSGMAGGDG